MFHFSLPPGGYLFLGTSETVDASVAPVHAGRQGASGCTAPTRSAGRCARSRDSRVRSRRPRGAGAATPRSRAARPPTPAATVHRELLEEFAPPSVLVNAEGRDRARRRARRALSALCRRRAVAQRCCRRCRAELRQALRTALFQALQLHDRGRRPTGAHRASTAGPMRVRLSVQPVRHPAWPGEMLLVVFDEVRRTRSRLPSATPARDPAIGRARGASCSSATSSCARRSSSTRPSSEELKASNEELQAINEELRSATEELETSKEELQSTNEELITVNHELKIKIDETTEINDDLSNLIASSGHRHRVRRRGDADQALHAGGGGDLQPDRRRRRPLAVRHHAPARVRRPGRGRPRGVRDAEDDRARGAAPTAAACSPGCCPTAPARTGSTARCSTSSTSPACARPRTRVELDREERLALVAETMTDFAILTIDPAGPDHELEHRAPTASSATTPRRRSASRSTSSSPTRTAPRGVPAGELREADDNGRAPDERWMRRKDGSRLLRQRRHRAAARRRGARLRQDLPRHDRTAPRPRSCTSRRWLTAQMGRGAGGGRERAEERVPGGDVARAQAPAQPDQRQRPAADDAARGAEACRRCSARRATIQRTVHEPGADHRRPARHVAHQHRQARRSTACRCCSARRSSRA